MSLKNFRKSTVLSLLFFLAVVPLMAGKAQAETIQYNVNFSSLGSWAGTSGYNLDYTLVPFGNANSSTTLTFKNFNYGTGGSGATSLGPLTDANTFEEISSPFTPGNSLSFDIFADFTPETPDPDVLTFGFLSNSSHLTQTDTTPTMGSVPGDGMSYFTIAFNGSNPTINTYAGTNPAFAAPTVQAVLTPEPDTWVLMILGLPSLAFALRRNGGWRSKKKDEQLTS